MKQTRINWENKIKHPIKGRLPDEVQPVVKARASTTKKNVCGVLVFFVLFTLARFEKDQITRRK